MPVVSLRAFSKYTIRSCIATSCSPWTAFSFRSFANSSCWSTRCFCILARSTCSVPSCRCSRSMIRCSSCRSCESSMVWHCEASLNSPGFPCTSTILAAGFAARSLRRSVLESGGESVQTENCSSSTPSTKPSGSPVSTTCNESLTHPPATPPSPLLQACPRAPQSYPLAR